MSFGHGPLDYIIVLLILAATARLLVRAPTRLLLWLPLFLTIDFFIPLVTQLTPGRLIPLMLGAWLVLKGRLTIGRDEAPWVLPFLLVLLASAAFALVVGDSGGLPIVRLAYYLGSWFVALFVVRVAHDREAILRLVRGFALAAVVHGGYAFYQLLASRVGLPFRGIVYDETEGGSAAAVIGSALRVNGLADEPKRLGYVLLAGVFALLFLQQNSGTPFVRRWAGPAALACLAVFLLTYSSSYFAASALTVAILLTTSTRLLRPALVVAVLGVGYAAVNVEETSRLVERLDFILNSRIEEVAAGTNTRFVYRQEFFAQEYLGDNPEI